MPLSVNAVLLPSRRGLGSATIVIACAVTACGRGPIDATATPAAPSGPTLSILAFGDSITFGVGATQPYPAALQTLLAGVYTKGPVNVTNNGTPGELAAQGVSRLATAVTLKPQVVLIMEGVNDLNAKVNNPDDPNDLTTAAAAIDSMVRESQQSGAIVVVATLPPERPGWTLLSGRPARSPELLDALNTEIRRIAAADKAGLADVAQAFDGNLALIGPDGLHPIQAGYDRIAHAFFDVLRPIVAGL